MVLALQERAGLSYLNAAERLYQLPMGLIAVAFGVAALPQLVRFLLVTNGTRQSQPSMLVLNWRF